MLEQTNMSVNINEFVATVVNWQWYSFPRPPWNISYFLALFFLSRNWRFPLSPVKNPGSQNTIVCIIRIKFDFIIVIIITIHHPIIVIIINLESISSWGQDGDPCEIVSWRLVLLRLIGWLSAVTWIEEDCFKQQYQCWRHDPSYVHNACI